MHLSQFIKIVSFIFLLLLGWSVRVEGGNLPANFQLQTKTVRVALAEIAYQLKWAIFLSPHIRGEVTINSGQANLKEVFATILLAYQLIMREEHGIKIIQTQDEWLARAEQQKVWQEKAALQKPLIKHSWKLKYAKAADVAGLIKHYERSLLSSRGWLMVDPRTNRITMQDIPCHIKTVAQLIPEWDEPIRQVLIEARIASIDYDNEQSLGIEWQSSAIASFGSGDAGSAKNEVRDYGISLAKLGKPYLLDLQLAALEKAGKAELISSPRLFAANQETAFIEAGEDIPYQEVSRGGGTAVAFKKAVLKLQVTPTILSSNNILLRLQINQDRASHRLVKGVPTITTRQITSHIRVKNGETIILGGIFEQGTGTEQRGLLGMGHIPFLKWLFSQQTQRKTKRELLIFVTPKLMV